MRSWLNSVVVGTIVLVVAFLAGPAMAKEPIQFTQGQMITYADGLEQGYDISGQATMVRSAEGHTTVIVRVHGLAPNSSYDVQVHDQSCNNEVGGSYYRHQADNAAEGSNEIGAAMTTNRGGHGFSKVVSDFVARSEARSVVVHDTNNTRLACADLHATGVSPYTFSAQKIAELAGSIADAVTPADPTFLAGDPELMEANRAEYFVTRITPADPTFLAGDPELLVVQQVEIIAEDGSGHYAANPELLVVRRYQFVGKDFGSLGSPHYANNPELMAAERYEAEIIRNLAIVDTVEGASE